MDMKQLFAWRQENLPGGGAKKDNHPKWVLQYLKSQNNRQNSHVLLIILDVKIKDWKKIANLNLKIEATMLLKPQ